MNKLIAFLCVFMYYTSPYRLFGHAMPEIIVLIAICLQLTQSRKIFIKNGYGPFMVYMLLFPALISFVTGLPGNYVISFIPVNLLLYSAAFCILLPNVDIKYVLKYYKILVYIAVCFFFIQEFAYYIIGNRPTLYFPLEMYYENSDIASFSESRASMNRSSSFFLEPAHFAQYILPYYCIVICNSIRDRIISKEAFILTLTLLLLQSGSGYLGMAAIFISILFLRNFVALEIKIAIAVVFACVIGIVTVFFINNPFIGEILSRVNEITSLEVSASGSQSGFLRIWRGYFIYGSLAPIYKLFGIGIGSFEYVSSLFYIPGSRYEGSYVNGIQTLLISGGMIGTALFFRFIFKISQRMSAEGIIVIICMIAMFFVEQMMFTPKMFLSILIAVAVSSNPRQIFNHRIKTAEVYYCH